MCYSMAQNIIKTRGYQIAQFCHINHRTQGSILGVFGVWRAHALLKFVLISPFRDQFDIHSESTKLCK